MQQQPSIQQYFKLKKRPRESSPSDKGQNLKNKIAHLDLQDTSETCTLSPKTATTVSATNSTTSTISSTISSTSTNSPNASVTVSKPTPSAVPIQQPEKSTVFTPSSPKKSVPVPLSPIKKLLSSPLPPVIDDDDVFSSPKKLVEYNAEQQRLNKGASAIKRLFNDGPSTSTSSVPAYKRFAHLLQKEPTLENKIKTLSSLIKPIDSAKVNYTNKSKIPESPIKKPVLPIPLSPIKKGISSTSFPVKSALCDKPIQKVTSTTTDEDFDFPLPIKYKILIELFRAVDMILHMKRKEHKIDFKELRMSTSELFRRVTLTIGHLHQINRVLPGSFTIVKGAKDIEIENPKVESQNLLTRRQTFKSNLLQITQKHHKDFLNQLSPPVIIPEGKKLLRWHPKFRVNEVPEIDGSKPGLLKGEVEDKTSHLNAKQIIERANNLLKKNPELFKKALLGEKSKKKEGVNPSNIPNISTITNAATSTITTTTAGVEANKRIVLDKETKERNDKLKGLSQSLIDRVRQRERDSAVQLISMTKEEKKTQTMKERLPQMIKIIKNVFVTEKKDAITLDLCLERLTFSLNNILTYNEVYEHLTLAAKILPHWFKILTFSSGKFIKIDKNLDISEVISKI